MATPALQFPEDLSPAQVASRLMKEEDGDIPRAARRLKAAADENTTLAARLTADLLENACLDACRAVRTRARHALWLPAHEQPEDTTKESNARARRAAEARLRDLYKWPLSCGVPLGDANRDQVKAEEVMYAAQAKANAERATFMRLVAARLVGDAIVRDVLTPEELGDMQQDSVSG